MSELDRTLRAQDQESSFTSELVQRMDASFFDAAWFGIKHLVNKLRGISEQDD